MKNIFKLLPLLSFCCEEETLSKVDLNRKDSQNNNINSPTNPNPANQLSSLPKCFNEPMMKLEDILTPLQLAGKIDYECFRWLNELAKTHNMDISDIDFDNFNKVQGDQLWEKLKKSSLKHCKAPERLRKLYDLAKNKFGYNESTCSMFGPKDKHNPLFSNKDIDFNDKGAVHREANKFMERATNPEVIKSLSDEDLNILEKGLLQSRLLFLGGVFV